MLTREQLQGLIKRMGSQTAVAEYLGISRQAVAQRLNPPDNRKSRRARYAENRKAGKCSCGQKPIPGRKTCRRCKNAGDTARARYAAYAKEHGCTLAEAQIVLRKRQWKRGK